MEELRGVLPDPLVEHWQRELEFWIVLPSRPACHRSKMFRAWRLGSDSLARFLSLSGSRSESLRSVAAF